MRDSTPTLLDKLDAGTVLVAGNICNTWEFDPTDIAASEKKVRSIFREQIQWAKAGGADFIVAEAFSHYGEARLSLEEIKSAGLPARHHLQPGVTGDLRRLFPGRGLPAAGG